MAQLVRWNPGREMTRMQDVMDRLFEEGFYRPWGWGMRRAAEGVGLIPLDIHENNDEYIVKAPMPGVTADTLEVTFEAGVLTVRGEVAEEKEVQGECILQERTYGKFARSVSLPSPVVPDKIAAQLKDGILTVRVPKAEEVKPKKISVKVE
jgi:HSP20 family protein